tara:strand:- start:34 stop:1122 length:1089 start_codon:yes stop_codon:yes gene_type:complete
MKLYRIGIHDKKLSFSKKEENKTIYTRKKELMDIKCKIDKCDQKKWEEVKKKYNLYEYIYTSSKQNNNICNIVPVSRSYFKLHEMIKNNHLLENNIYCACLAEGPGGFIHCLNNYSYEYGYSIKKIFGITLISKNRSIPYWNQLILNNKMNYISDGNDKTGNLYNYKNALHFIKNVNHDYCHLVTADGGFDYSKNYNSQEDSSYKLIYSEIYIALNIQRIKGNFIIKIFDLFNYKTIQLLYLLYNCYSIIEIYKPLTSRLSNSEKYIICSNFLGCSPSIKEKMKEYYNKCNDLHIDIPESFIQDIIQFNDSFVLSQIESINEILKNIDNTTSKGPSKKQIQYATQWCELYELPINSKCIYLK